MLFHTGCCSSQTAEKHIGHLLERQDNKRGDQNQNWTTNHGQHTERKTISQAWTRDSNGSPAHTTAYHYKMIQERTKNLQKMGLTSEEAEVAAIDRHGVRAAQCVQLNAGYNQGQGQRHVFLSNYFILSLCYDCIVNTVFSRPYWVVRSRLWYDVLSVCRLSVCNVLYCG